MRGIMTHKHTSPTFLRKFAGVLLAASFLTGCGASTAPVATMVQAGAQPGPQAEEASFSEAAQMPQPARCESAPEGEMQLRLQREQAFVSLTVNNQRLNLLLDTGDFVTSLTPFAVSRLALQRSNQPGLTMTGIGGDYEAPIVEAADVQYLSHRVDNLSFAVLPASEFRPEEKVDGLFGANFLSAYDVELDFPGKKMRFFRRNPECGVSAPAWTSHATRLQAADAGHNLLLIPVRINGVALNALIDTGSEDTSITRSAAEELGVTRADMRGDVEITEQGLGTSTERLHRFASISLGNATFDHPVLAVDDEPSPLQANILMATASALPVPHKGVDVILGANYLFKKRIFLAYGSQQVFIE